MEAHIVSSGDGGDWFILIAISDGSERNSENASPRIVHSQLFILNGKMPKP